MIYRVLIGTYTRNGNFQQMVERIVECDGRQYEVQDYFSKQYAGFQVNVYQVEKIETIKQEKKDTKTEQPVKKEQEKPMKKRTYTNVTAELNESELEQYKYVKETRREFDKSLSLLKTMISDRYKKNEYIRYTENVKISFPDPDSCSLDIILYKDLFEDYILQGGTSEKED